MASSNKCKRSKGDGKSPISSGLNEANPLGFSPFTIPNRRCNPLSIGERLIRQVEEPKYLGGLRNITAADIRKLRRIRKEKVAGVTGLEPATSGVTGQRSNQLSYTPATFP